MSDRRAITDPERTRLGAELARAKENPVGVMPALWAAGGVLAAYLWRPLIALGVMALIGHAVLPEWLMLFLARAAGGSALLACGTVALLVITANRSWMSFLARLAQGVERDLADGQVIIESYRAVGAITLKLDDGPPQGYVLELDGGRLVFVPAALADGPPAERLEIAIAPESRVYVSARASGAPLAAPERAPATTALAPVMAQPCVPVAGALASLPESRRAELT